MKMITLVRLLHHREKNLGCFDEQPLFGPHDERQKMLMALEESRKKTISSPIKFKSFSMNSGGWEIEFNSIVSPAALKRLLRVLEEVC